MVVPHALVLPLPYQGHVIPLMELSHCLVDHGFTITFVNTQHNHDRVVANMRDDQAQAGGGQIRMVSVADGLGNGDDRNDLLKLMAEGLAMTLPKFLEETVLQSGKPGGSGGGGAKINCLIYDVTLGWAAMPVAKKMGLRSAMFSPMSALVTLTTMRIPKFVEDGIVDTNGAPATMEMFQLGPGLPFISAAHLPWNCRADEETSKNIFHFYAEKDQVKIEPDFILCNSFHDIEAPVFAHAPIIRPVGPLLVAPGRTAGNFWPEDATCAAWLDEQRPNSILYVAFGSTKMFTRRQFEELALGLEISGRPFLLVVRPDCYVDNDKEKFLDGFRCRVAERGKIVDWAPQQNVLMHPAIACFVCHCGWNSTMEGVMNGTPFLCWPYSTDNFISESYICDVWKTGLRLQPDEEKVIAKEQIKAKVEELLGDEEMRLRAMKLKEMAMRSVTKAGTSFQNLKSFADDMRT